MLCAKSQVSEAATGLTASPGRFYSFSTLLPVTYSHPSKLSSKASSLHVSRLDSAFTAWHFAFSLQIHACPGQCCPSNVQGTCVSPICTVCPMDTICGTMAWSTAGVSKRILHPEPLSIPFLCRSLRIICITMNTPFLQVQSELLFTECVQIPTHQTLGQFLHELDLLPVLASESLSTRVQVNLQIPVLGHEWWWQMDLHLPSTVA